MADVHKGHVFWITGLPGAGKSAIGKLLFDKLKNEHPNTVYLDGDVFREILNDDRGYDAEDRKKLAMLYGRFCYMLADQGINVVCATVSMFHDARNWNRENITNYVEIYLKVPIKVLIARDQKQLYSRAMKGEIKNVIGINMEMEEPKNSDIVLANEGDNTPQNVFDRLLLQLSTLSSLSKCAVKEVIT